ncbi:MAG: HDOD domain-containing protein [Rubrivivax sp.]|nr:HDOD domain-containing protein [Rubrivivax sp.]
MPSAAASSSAGARPGAVRQFARFGLLRLLGRSDHSMVWLVADPRSGADQVLVLPRHLPHGDGALERWLHRVRRAARLNHPQLAPAVEIGVHDHWPFVLYDLDEQATLTDRIGSKGLPAQDSAAIMVQLLEALAFTHDAGMAHGDLQGFMVLVSDKGQARLIGTEVGSAIDEAPGAEMASMRAQRQAAAADVLQVGILMHQVLTGMPALDEPDTAKVAQRLPPAGREIVRLPFSTPRPVPDTLRVIVNRATDRQERQRYQSARTLARALEGWLKVDGAKDNGPLALLLDRLRAVGVLPASRGGAERAARLALMERGRNDELAEVLLEDVALAFELLRVVNTAQVRGAQISGNGAVLTIRRAIAMVGLEGVRRVALSLRTWPGPLAPGHATELQRALDRARRAGRVAISIRPPGYDAEVVYLVTLLQNLGRLVVHYHFPDEAAQIHRLMQPAPAAEPGEHDEPGMTEQGAALAVLGVDLEAIGNAVARWWGLDDAVLHMMRRHAPGAAVRPPDSDDEQIRITASCANEAMDAQGLQATHVLHAMQGVSHRYGRALSLTLRDLQSALQGAPAAFDEDDDDSPAWRPPHEMPTADAGLGTRPAR